MCEGIMKIFVETGPGFDECAVNRRIEVDLKGPGEHLRIRVLARLQLIQTRKESQEVH
jgi:hypothetical protein